MGRGNSREGGGGGGGPAGPRPRMPGGRTRRGKWLQRWRGGADASAKQVRDACLRRSERALHTLAPPRVAFRLPQRAPREADEAPPAGAAPHGTPRADGRAGGGGSPAAGELCAQVRDTVDAKQDMKQDMEGGTKLDLEQDMEGGTKLWLWGAEGSGRAVPWGVGAAGAPGATPLSPDTPVCGAACPACGRPRARPAFRRYWDESRARTCAQSKAISREGSGGDLRLRAAAAADGADGGAAAGEAR